MMWEPGEPLYADPRRRMFVPGVEFARPMIEIIGGHDDDLATFDRCHMCDGNPAVGFPGAIWSKFMKAGGL